MIISLIEYKKEKQRILKELKEEKQRRLREAPQFKLKWDLKKSIMDIGLYNIIRKEKRK